MKKVGIFGGTFDPPHNGHMLVARAAMEQLGLDEIRIMTGGMPPHKQNDGMTPAEIRHTMVRLAAEGEPGFRADGYEVHKKNYTYTAKTLEELLAENPDWEIYFVIGEDSLRDFMKWYKPDYIAKHCILCVYPRSRGDALDRLIAERRAELGADIRRIDSPLFGVSSTEIRKRLKAGKSVRYLVPDAVNDYIKEKGLYS